jgi:DNA (cytosine-5)-methyltransferase 1
MMWFTKSRRAQNNEDFETWIVGGVSPTLNAFDNTGDKRATVIIAFDNSYRDGLRLQEGNTINTLSAKMGTGGNNVPFLAIPIQDGRAMDKKQNGFGVGIEGDPSYTLDQTGSQSVAIPIQGTIIGRQDHNGPQGKGFGDEGDPSYTLDSISQHGVATEMQVRRLTPLECERLMGWPDNHTQPRADGKQNSDTTRYKMCGNGVATPVAKWIGEKIVGIQQSTPRL